MDVIDLEKVDADAPIFTKTCSAVSGAEAVVHTPYSADNGSPVKLQLVPSKVAIRSVLKGV
jgi:hypothetical protein